MTNGKHIVIDARIRRSSTGRYTDRLLEHLQKLPSPHRFTVLIEPDDAWRPRTDNITVIPCRFRQFSFNPLNDVAFGHLLRKLKPDLVHFTMTQQPLSYWGKTITTTHDLTMLRFVRAGKTPAPIFWLKRLGYRLMFYLVHKRTDLVIVPTKFVAQDLARYYAFTASKTEVTYESSEPPISEPADRPKNITKPFIMHVGSPFPHKNIYRLIAAFDMLAADHPKLQLVLAGKEEFYFKELKQWAKKQPSYSRIQFTGFVSDSELKWLYKNAEAYVLPSLSEGFGLPGMEAMSHGCPLVSSSATCLPEVYGDAALYFDPLNVHDMATAISSMLGDKKIQKKYVAAGHQQLKKYSWQAMAKQTHELYDKALVR